MWNPAGHRLKVLPDKTEDKIGSLFVPLEAKERKENENVFGTLVAIGPNAWKAFDDGKPWAKVGDRISYAKYGGVWFFSQDEIGEDGKPIKYRIINDEDLITVWDKKE